MIVWKIWNVKKNIFSQVQGSEKSEISAQIYKILYDGSEFNFSPSS